MTKLLFACRYSRPNNLHGFLRFFTIHRRLIDRVDHFHSFSHRAKRGKLAVEMWRRANENEEMRRGAVWFVCARHRYDAANVLDESGLVRQMAGHAFG